VEKIMIKRFLDLSIGSTFKLIDLSDKMEYITKDTIFRKTGRIIFTQDGKNFPYYILNNVCEKVEVINEQYQNIGNIEIAS
jgi:uncharacterized protein Yka (UPF0111/DUF47 family)